MDTTPTPERGSPVPPSTSTPTTGNDEDPKPEVKTEKPEPVNPQPEAGSSLEGAVGGSDNATKPMSEPRLIPPDLVKKTDLLFFFESLKETNECLGSKIANYYLLNDDI